MACKPEVLKDVPLFALLDEEERSVLAGQIDLKTFAPRERIYKMGDPAPQAYVLIGNVRVSTVDEDHQEVVVDEPGERDFFGFASMLEQTPHQTNAHATVYTGINVALDKKAWDPYPFILLNLFLSMLAAAQAPVIMMSQNRQDAKDRVRGELDFEVNRRAEVEIQGLAHKLSLLDDKFDDLAGLLRTTKDAKVASPTKMSVAP
jgi:CRP-like cAMP-binding protein